MAEVEEESTHVWSHKQRIVLFLSAMRHFRDSLKEDSIRVEYHQLEADGESGSLQSQLTVDLQKMTPSKVVLVHPGDWRVLQQIRAACDKVSIELEVRDDHHFYTTPEEFKQHADGRKALRMEFFYRELRKRFDVLMEDGKPVGGDWNYDKENRGSFSKSGPKSPNQGPAFEPDETTCDVISLVESRFAQHPGSLENFAWPVTPEQASNALDTFVEQRLPSFGQYQDAMWRREPWLYHSLLSTSLNLKLLNPRQVVEAAELAYAEGRAPLAAVEGFIRQILGWREYVRGIYWMEMPNYAELNAMGASEPLPEFYWNGETDLECLKQAIGQTLEHGYAHHIQRLMVTGLYTLLLGVDPKQVHEWYLAVYVDAVEWVELPNTLGMSQYADGGLMASKPYVATGSYINKMSNYCKSCPKNPKEKTGENACPFTTLYWDYLLRHQEELGKNNRMSLQLRNLNRLSSEDRSSIIAAANQVRKKPAVCFSGKELL